MNIASNFQEENLQKENPNSFQKIQRLVNYISLKALTFVGIRKNLIYFQRCFNSLIILQMFALKNQTKIVKRFQTQYGHVTFLGNSSLIILLGDQELHVIEQDNFQNWCLRKVIQFKVQDPEYRYIPKMVKWNWNEDFLIILVVKYYFLVKNDEHDWICLEAQGKNIGRVLEVLSNKSYTAIFYHNFFEEKIVFDKIDKAGQCKSFAEIEINHRTHCHSCVLDWEKFVLFYEDLNLITFWKIDLKTEKPIKLQELHLNFIQSQQKTSENYNIVYLRSLDLLIAQNLGVLYLILQKNGSFFIQETIVLPILGRKLSICDTEEYLFYSIYIQKLSDCAVKNQLLRLCIS